LSLLATTFILTLIYFALIQFQHLPRWLGILRAAMERSSFWFLILLVLLPVAMTMALLWKTKEVILESVFGTED
jgi:hypothetical protein